MGVCRKWPQRSIQRQSGVTVGRASSRADFPWLVSSLALPTDRAPQRFQRLTPISSLLCSRLAFAGSREGSLTQPVAVRHNLVRKNETPISTIENAPQTATRFPESQLYQERQSHFGQSPSRGPQAVDAGLIRHVRRAFSLVRLPSFQPAETGTRISQRKNKRGTACLRLYDCELVVASRKFPTASRRGDK